MNVNTSMSWPGTDLRPGACSSSGWRRALACLVLGAFWLAPAGTVAAPEVVEPEAGDEAALYGPYPPGEDPPEVPSVSDEPVEDEGTDRVGVGEPLEPPPAAPVPSGSHPEPGSTGPTPEAPVEPADDEAEPVPPEPTAAEESRFKALLTRLRPTVRIPVRLNTTVQGEPHNRLDGYRFDTLFTLPRLSGKITDLVGWQLGFFGRANDFAEAELRVLDVIAELNILPQLQLWAGRFIVPGDRSNLSGPFFVPVWNYPGVYANVYTIGPVGGAVGRDVGGIVWGEIGEGRFKYYAAVQSLDDTSVRPRMTGRVNFTLLGREPGFYNASSYLGKRDVVAIGGSLQYQPSGERTLEDPMDPESAEIVQGDLWVADVDLIAEKNFGRGGTPTLEATYYAFDRFRPYRHAFFVSAAYLLPWEIGPGKIQVGTRWQQAFPGVTTDTGLAGLDVSTAYLFAGYRARAVLVYQHQRLGDGGPPWNALNIGFQFIVI